MPTAMLYSFLTVIFDSKGNTLGHKLKPISFAHCGRRGEVNPDTFRFGCCVAFRRVAPYLWKRLSTLCAVDERSSCLVCARLVSFPNRESSGANNALHTFGYVANEYCIHRGGTTDTSCEIHDLFWSEKHV